MGRRWLGAALVGAGGLWLWFGVVLPQLADGPEDAGPMAVSERGSRWGESAPRSAGEPGATTRRRAPRGHDGTGGVEAEPGNGSAARPGTSRRRDSEPFTGGPKRAARRGEAQAPRDDAGEAAGAATALSGGGRDVPDWIKKLPASQQRHALERWKRDERVEDMRASEVEYGAVSGRVLDAEGNPLAGATCSWAPGSFATLPQGAIPIPTQSGGGGIYTLEGVPAKSTVLIQCSATGYLSGTSQSLTLPGPQLVEGIDIALGEGEGGIIRGRVLRADGEVIPQAWIYVRQANRPVRSGATDAHGEYRLEHVPAGRQLVVARAPRYKKDATVWVEVPAGDEVTAPDIVFQDGSSRIAGQVLRRDGAGVRGARVVITDEADSSRRYVTDTRRNGLFNRGELAEGRYRVDVYHPGYCDARADAVAAPSSGLRIELEEGGRLEGQVSGPDGAPEFLELRMHLVAPAVAESGGVPVADKLSYRVLRESGGQIEAWARAGRWNLFVRDKLGDAVGLLLEEPVSCGQTSRVSVNLQAPRIFTGEIVDGEGAPVPGALIRGVQLGIIIAEARSGGSGAFRVAAVPGPHGLTLRPSHPGYLTAPQVLSTEGEGEAPALQLRMCHPSQAGCTPQ